MTEIEKLKDAVKEADDYLSLKVDNRLAKAVKTLADFARIAVESAGDWPTRKEHKDGCRHLGGSCGCDCEASAYNEAVLSCTAAHTAILAEERSKSLPSKEELQAIIQDINFESYGFSHEEVAVKTAEAIHSAMLKKRGE